jgi:hypothetical protein
MVPFAAAIAGCVIPLSRNNTIWMRWRCAAVRNSPPGQLDDFRGERIDIYIPRQKEVSR